MAPGHQHLRPLANDITAQANPRPAYQLQAEPDRFPERAGNAPRQAGRLQHDKKAASPTGKRSKAMDPVCHVRRPGTG